MSTSSFLELHNKVRKSLFSDYISGAQFENSATNRKSINFVNSSFDQVNIEKLIQYIQISRGIANQSTMTLSSSPPKETQKQRAKKAIKNSSDSMIRSHKKKKYQPKVVVKKLRKSLVQQSCNRKATEKTPKRDSPLITSTPNCHKTLSENSAINLISFSMEKDFDSSDSEPLINFIPPFNKRKTKSKNTTLSQKRINYDDYSTVEEVNNNRNTVGEAFSNSLKRGKRDLNSKIKTMSSVDKENSVLNNTENAFKKPKKLTNNKIQGKENRRLEDSKTDNRKSPIKKNKILDKIANRDSATRLQNKSTEKSFQQPLAAVNENLHPQKTNRISNDGSSRINDSNDNNKALKENTEKIKVKKKINQVKELQLDKNKSDDDNNDELLSNPHVSNVDPISDTESIITKNSTIPVKPVIEPVPPKAILTDVLFLPPLLNEKYKSLRASNSRKNNTERKISCRSELSSSQTSICSSDSDVVIIDGMSANEQYSQDFVHDMSLSVKPDWLKTIMKTTKDDNNVEAARKRKPEDRNEEYLLNKKKRKIIQDCSLPLTEKARTDFDFFQKVASCPDLQSQISKFHFEIYLHEQLNSIKNELTREDTKWKINLLVRKALLKDRDESK